MTRTKLIGTSGVASLMLILAGCGGIAWSDSASQEAAEESRINQPVAAEAPLEADTAVETGHTSTQTSSAYSKEKLPEETASGDVAAAETGEAAAKTVIEGKPAAVAPILPGPENVLAEEEYRWNQLLPRDGIRPIYEEEVELVEAKNAPYDDDELVIGVEINGEAKAYAIGPLNSREMVNDTVGGVPILVTW